MQIETQHTLLVTGACGFIGKFLVEELLKTTNYKLVLFCRKADQNQFGSRVTFVEGDLNDTKKFDEIFNCYRPGIVVHMAALARLSAGEDKPDEAFRTNYLATKHLIDLSIATKTKSFIFISTDMAREHLSVVGITKYLAEAYLQKTAKVETKLITVRLPNIAWTPGSVHLVFEKLISENKNLTITHPEMSRRFISGKEAAENIIFAMKTGNDRDIFVELREPEKITDLAKAMIKSCGKEIGVEFIGMKPGEKLTENSYNPGQVEHTHFKQLALLKNKTFGETEIETAWTRLQTKPGFTFEIKNN
jgi:FlaA1/EpsC-like NDP-sugar epimerase